MNTKYMYDQIQNPDQSYLIFGGMLPETQYFFVGPKCLVVLGVI